MDMVVEKMEAYEMGEMAFARGRNFLRDNPYQLPTLREFWRQGFKDAGADRDERTVNQSSY